MNAVSSLYGSIRALKRISPELLRSLLDPHVHEFRAQGLSIDGLACPQALWEARERLPERLLDALDAIAHMCDEVGRQELFSAAARRGLHPSPQSASVSVATRMWVEHRSSFHEALARRSVELTRPFREFVGRRLGRPSWTEEGLRSAEKALATFFEQTGGAGYCRIRHWQAAELHHFLVSHAPSHQVQHEVRGGTIVTHTGWPEQHELVIFDERTGRLRIGARASSTRRALREAWGTLLFAEHDWFTQRSIIRLDPLLNPARALTLTEGLLDIRVVEVGFAHTGRCSGTVKVQGKNVMGLLTEMQLDPAAHGQLRTVNFLMHHRSDQSWRMLSLGSPNRITEDWHHDGYVARRYLESRGFLEGAPEESS